MRESKEAKAVRLLAEGSVKIVGANTTKVYALVAGDTADYEIQGYKDQFGCSCANVKNDCSHIEAVKKVWACH